MKAGLFVIAGITLLVLSRVLPRPAMEIVLGAVCIAQAVVLGRIMSGPCKESRPGSLFGSILVEILTLILFTATTIVLGRRTLGALGSDAPAIEKVSHVVLNMGLFVLIATVAMKTSVTARVIAGAIRLRRDQSLTR